MWKACCYSREASAANGRCCLWDVFEEFNEGIAKATVLTCCLLFFFIILRRMGCRSLFFSIFFKFAPLFPFPSAFCRFFLPLLRCFVCSTPFICVVSLVCNSYLFLFSTHVVLLAAFPFRSPCILFFSTHVVSFALLFFLLLFISFLHLFSSLFCLVYGLHCFVMFSYSVP